MYDLSNFDRLYGNNANQGSSPFRAIIEEQQGPTEAELMREQHGTFNEALPSMAPAQGTGGAVPEWWGRQGGAPRPSPVTGLTPGGGQRPGRVPMVQMLSAQQGRTVVSPQRALANALRGGSGDG